MTPNGCVSGTFSGPCSSVSGWAWQPAVGRSGQSPQEAPACRLGPRCAATQSPGPHRRHMFLLPGTARSTVLGRGLVDHLVTLQHAGWACLLQRSALADLHMCCPRWADPLAALRLGCPPARRLGRPPAQGVLPPPFRFRLPGRWVALVLSVVGTDSGSGWAAFGLVGVVVSGHPLSISGHAPGSIASWHLVVAGSCLLRVLASDVDLGP